MSTVGDRGGKAGSMLRRAVASEAGTYRSLARWVSRQPSIPPGSTPIGYARLVSPVLWLFVFGSAIEVVVVDVLLPWAWARVVAVVLGIWSLLWMLGMLAGYRVHPHLVERAGLRVRNGPMIDVPVLWDTIASVRVDERDLPTSVRSLQPLETDDGVDLCIGVSGRVNVRLDLREPTRLPIPTGSTTAVRVAFWVDDPREVVAMLRTQLASPA